MSSNYWTPDPTVEDEASDDLTSQGSNDAMWILFWILSLFIFLAIPVCASPRQRKLCFRRIRERRWIQDDGQHDWYREVHAQRQARRQQELENQHQRFQTSRTQEDEIREHYLLFLMEKYTLVSWERAVHSSLCPYLSISHFLDQL
jgi:hypothetical protein